MPNKADRSLLTEAVLEVANEVKELRRNATTNAVPFMQEAVSPSVIRRRYPTMTPQERETLVKQHGVDKVMQMLRGGKS
jgi:hypothetical protein